jgi:putative ABC transport system permease protein
VISAGRLAWLQLRRQKVRLAIAIAGVAFAVILMSMQLAFQDALFLSAVNVHGKLKGDLFLVHPNYNVLALPTVFPRVRLYQALGVKDVASVTPIYTAIVPWKNPETGRTRNIFLLGIDPVADVFDATGVRPNLHLVRYPDVVIFDAFSRAEFGPVAGLVRAGTDVTTEVRHREVTVRGLFEMGTSFGIDGTVYTSDLNYLRIAPERSAAEVSIGLVRLVPGADPQAVQTTLRAHLPPDVRILTKQEFMDREIDYWSKSTPIGFVFTFGVVMGLVVGMIIVYQILFADIADHLHEYATLKAMGYTHRYLVGVVLMEAAILGVAGFAPGLAICTRLYAITEQATMLPMATDPLRAAQVLLLTLVMCWASGMIAMRRLEAADPADVF